MSQTAASTQRDAAPSDYERAGGGRGVGRVVTRFYDLVLDDKQLASFFTGTDLVALKRHQVLLISQVLGGPAEYSGRDLREAHAGLTIAPSDFARVVAHLVTALQECEVPDDVIARAGEVLGASEPDVVSAGSV